MPGENILVIAVDGLRAAALGAYGNTSFATPGLDTFAAESFLFDSAFADAVSLPAIYRALWQSRHPLRGDTELGNRTTLPRLLADRGYTTTLVTDDPAVAAFPEANDFGELVQLTVATPERAADVSETALARIFTAACDEINVGDTNRLIWLHAAGIYGPWDAPLELQESLLERDEGDPLPSDELLPPDVLLNGRNDPDAAFRWSCAYAAQVMALDACVAALRDAIAEVDGDRWLVVLLGLRGFPLGEHGRIGGVDGRLCVEQLQVPLLWRSPDGTGRLARSNDLASHLDLLPTLVDFVGGGEGNHVDGASLLPQANDSAPSARLELVAAGDDGSRAIRTAEWTLRTSPDDAGAPAPVELFVRPDDRWEANDVAALCPDVVYDLTARLAAASASMAEAAKSP